MNRARLGRVDDGLFLEGWRGLVFWARRENGGLAISAGRREWLCGGGWPFLLTWRGERKSRSGRCRWILSPKAFVKSRSPLDCGEAALFGKVGVQAKSGTSRNMTLAVSSPSSRAALATRGCVLTPGELFQDGGSGGGLGQVAFLDGDGDFR